MGARTVYLERVFARLWMERILAIDFGLRRFGLAVSDALGITAQGLPTYQRVRMEDDLRRIQELVSEYDAACVVLGNPVGHSGRQTEISAYVEQFAVKLRSKLTCEVKLWDERLTSVAANRILRDSGMGIEKRKRAVDRVAATILLQGYLDRLAYKHGPAARQEAEPE